MLARAVAVTLLFVASTSAAAQDRVALVIGNGAYTQAPPLANPPNDANDIAASLERLGFEVVKLVDGDRLAMERALRSFSNLLESADVGLFFYAGHGLQVNGQNYLLPTNARLVQEQDLLFEAISIGLVNRIMEQSGTQTRILILDACRDNPLARSLARSVKTAGRSAQIGQGLARIEEVSGTLIAYATAPGNIAEDGAGRNSPFTAALLEQMNVPGLEVRSMMGEVRAAVYHNTKQKQLPWVSDSLIGKFFFRPQTASSEVASEQRTPTDPGTESLFWQSIKDSADPMMFQAYLDRYPNGAFVPIARLKVKAAEERRRAEAPLREQETEPQRRQSTQGARIGPPSGSQPIPPASKSAQVAVAIPAPRANVMPENSRHPYDGRYRGRVKRTTIKDWNARAQCPSMNVEITVTNGHLEGFATVGKLSIGTKQRESGSYMEIEGRINETGRGVDVRARFFFAGLNFSTVEFEGTVEQGKWTEVTGGCAGVYELNKVE